MEGNRTWKCFHFDEWASLQTFSPSLYWVMMAINGLSILPTVILNVCIILSIVKTPALKTTPSMIIIGNIATSDMVVGLIAQPIFITWITMESMEIQTNCICTISILFGISSTLFAGVSLLSITASSVDRYLALRLHLRYSSVVTARAVVIVCAIVWLFVLAISLSWLFLGFSSFNYFVVASMAICIVSTLVFYGVIFKTLRRHQKQIITQQMFQTENSTVNTNASLKRFRKTLISTLLIYATFLFCYLPLFCFLVLYWVEGPTFRTVLGIKLSTNIVFLNSAINPAIFLCRIFDLRQACKNTLLSILIRLNVHVNTVMELS